MLEQAQRNIQANDQASSTSLVTGRAGSLPFPSGSFDAVVFTYLLRYEEDPQATLGELARVLRPRGQLAPLDFSVPQSPFLPALWLLHVRALLPLGTRFPSAGRREAGSFLGPSISAFYGEHDLADLTRMWAQAGIDDVQARALSLGGAVVMWRMKGNPSEI